MKCSSATLACDPFALSPSEREEHPARLRAVRAAAISLLDGETLQLSFADDPLVAAQIGHWMVVERRCCPFLSFVLRADVGKLTLEVRGPAEGLALLRAALG